MSIKLMIAQISISLLYFEISSKCIKERLYCGKVIFYENGILFLTKNAGKNTTVFFFAEFLCCLDICHKE